MTSVFISYSHKDKGYAENLAKALEGHGLTVWIDDRIDYGTQWPRVIQENLETCNAFIVIMTPRSLESIWVQNELTYAMSNHKPIFPVLLEGTVWFTVSALQVADVRGGKLPPEEFYKDIKNKFPVAPAKEVKPPQQAGTISWQAPKKEKPVAEAPVFLPLKSPVQSVDLGEVTVQLNASAFSGWHTNERLQLDGKDIAIEPYSTDLKGFTKIVYQKKIPVGEHHIKISWGSDHAGQDSKTFKVSKDNHTFIYLDEKLHFFRSYTEWSISIIDLPVLGTRKWNEPLR